IEDKVLFLGLRDDAHMLLKGIDLLLFPSLYEGLPLSLVEAQASGLRILASTNVTKEIAITDLVSFHDLQKGEEFWADLALNNLKYHRESKVHEIIENGYDIKVGAKKLQDFYLDNYPSHVRN
ncbi:MAG: glycosyltransferase, partial [Allomuricauda sp.]